jgi:hypothetical protein
MPGILKKLLDLRQDIDMKSELLANMREMFKAAYFYETSGKKHSARRSKVENDTIKILSVEESIQKNIRELALLTGKFMETLDRIDDARCRELLVYRYLCGNTWDQVAEKMNYSRVHILNRLHPKAVKLLEENKAPMQT